MLSSYPSLERERGDVAMPCVDQRWRRHGRESCERILGQSQAEKERGMPTYDYDVLVVGAGQGGLPAAHMAANLGAKVALIEEREVGGT